MSWDDIDKVEEPKKQQEEQITKFCSLCYQVFKEYPTGRELMDILNLHLDTAVCPPDKEASYGYFREGQNNIIRQMKNAIHYHENKMRASNG